MLFLKFAFLFQLLASFLLAVECDHTFAQLDANLNPEEAKLHSQVQALYHFDGIINSAELAKGLAQANLSNTPQKQFLAAAIELAKKYLLEGESAHKVQHLEQIRLLQDSPEVIELISTRMVHDLRKYDEIITGVDIDFSEWPGTNWKKRAKSNFKLGVSIIAASLAFGYWHLLPQEAIKPGISSIWNVLIPVPASVFAIMFNSEFYKRRWRGLVPIPNYDYSRVIRFKDDFIAAFPRSEELTLAVIASRQNSIAEAKRLAIESTELESGNKRVYFKVRNRWKYRRQEEQILIPVILIARGNTPNTWLAISADDRDSALAFKNRVNLYQLKLTDVVDFTSSPPDVKPKEKRNTVPLSSYFRAVDSILIGRTTRSEMADQDVSSQQRLLRNYLVQQHRPTM